MVPGCTGGPSELAQDGDFEAGGRGWFWLEGHSDWGPFEIASGAGLDGSAALRAVVDSDATPSRVLVVGGVQNFTAAQTGGRLPRHIVGQYRVEAWNSTVPKTYLQVVVSVFPRDGAKEKLCPPLPEPTYPCQAAFVLAGIDRVPIPFLNRKFFFLGTQRPSVGPWHGFDIPLRQDFLEGWGVEPQDFDHFWLYLETRFEKEGDAAGQAAHVVVDWDRISVS